MLLLESELVAPSNKIETINRRQATLREMIIEAEQEGADADTLRQLRGYIRMFDRMRERVKAMQGQIL